MPIRPPRLQSGQTLGIVAPASPPPDPQKIDRAVANLERLGFKVKLAPNVSKRRGFLAGTDRERASDIMRLFADRKVNAILCTRGGHGTTRLLPLLDYKLIRDNAKIFVGYSDITALHCAFLTKADLISFHGPMLNADFSGENLPAFTLQSFLRTLQAAEKPRAPIGVLQDSTDVTILRRGIVCGQLIGGNLSLLCALVGTPWLPQFRGRILFIEDVGEQPYRIDRMLTHLLNCGLLQQVAGIAIGTNKDCEDPRVKQGGEFRQTAADVFRDRLLPLRIPIVTGLPFGHIPLNATLPVGIRVKLDANRGDLILEEPPVR